MNFNKPSDLLMAAKAVIADPTRFTTDSIARDCYGATTSSLSDDATCWCSVGAYYKAIGFDYLNTEIDSKAFGFLVKAVGLFGGTAVADYSDTHIHTEVMTMWDKAIELAIANETGDELTADL